jgi:CheY-like chemotaxis protein
MRVLVIEDNKDVAGNIGDFFEARGHEVDFAYDGVVGLHLAVTQSFEVIVLDLGLPGIDGLTLCRRLRDDAGSEVPVLMLTARDMLSDKLEGFDVGADDYLVKPFALQELGARLEVLSRRRRRKAPETIRVADLELHTGRFDAFRRGRRLKLNPTGPMVRGRFGRRIPGAPPPNRKWPPARSGARHHTLRSERRHLHITHRRHRRGFGLGGHGRRRTRSDGGTFHRAPGGAAGRTGASSRPRRHGSGGRPC